MTIKSFCSLANVTNFWPLRNAYAACISWIFWQNDRLRFLFIKVDLNQFSAFGNRTTLSASATCSQLCSNVSIRGGVLWSHFGQNQHLFPVLNTLHHHRSLRVKQFARRPVWWSVGRPVWRPHWWIIPWRFPVCLTLSSWVDRDA